MLYRLDYINADGSLEAVPDMLVIWPSSDLSEARTRAIEHAAIRPNPDKRSVLVTSIQDAGIMRRAIIAHPDGRVTRA